MKKIKQLIWPAIMAMYGLTILVLMVTGELKAYIHPKLHILNFLSMIILFILAFATARENMKKDIVPSLKWTYLLFILPLLLFFIDSDANASRQVAVENGLKISAVSNKDQEDSSSTIAQANEIQADNKQEDTDLSESKETDTQADDSSDQKNTSENYVDENGVLHLTDNNYTVLMEDVHVNLESYIGKKISYRGLIYKQEDFTDSEMVVGRLLMYCCAADAQVMGLLGISEDGHQYADGDWVTIIGEVNQKEYKDPYSDYVDMIPYLMIEDIRPAEEPDDPYVYFNE